MDTGSVYRVRHGYGDPLRVIYGCLQPSDASDPSTLATQKRKTIQQQQQQQKTSAESINDDVPEDNL